MGECKSAVYVRNGVASATSFEYQVKATGQAASDLGCQVAPHTSYTEGDMQKQFESQTGTSSDDAVLWMPSFSSKNSFLELGRG